MFIQDNVPLQAYSTMRLGGKAAYLSEINSREELPKLVDWANERKLPILMIGDGSNIVWSDNGFDGLVIVNKIMGFETQKFDENTTFVTAGAGENWDSLVERSVALGLGGIAELSLIPGTAGATPIQNVGAYGREISDMLVTLEAFDLNKNKFLTMPAGDCEFGYRTSRFKTTDKRNFLITSITLLLNNAALTKPHYDSLASYFESNHIDNPTPQDIREAVIAIRSAKLPDVKFVANNGSFFANPFIGQDKLTGMLSEHPAIKYWHTDDDRIKLSAAWLVEHAGFNDYHDPETGMSTWKNQALVLVNEKANSTADLIKFRDKIANKVFEQYGVKLEQEPELLP